MSPRFFATVRDFERWLAANHGKSRSLLVGFYKVGSSTSSITYPEALDAVLAYGWIDGVRKSLDADAYTIRFAPRKNCSYWSAVNTKRVKELIKSGRMKRPGLEAFEARDTARTRRYAYERANTELDATSMRTLRADKKARAFFESLPPGFKKIVVRWVTSAKREQTRARRLAHLIERSRAGRRIDLLRPYSRD